MKQVHESFSALMDNEADEFDLRRVLKTVSASPEQAETWRRYHLARSMMQRERESIVDVDISGDVMAALADEPQPSQVSHEGASRRHSFSLMGGAAVAAAVSLMVITGVQVYNGRFAGDSTITDVASDGSGAQATLASDASSVAEGGGAVPASMEAPNSTGLPYFTGGNAGNGLMTVGEPVMQPLFMEPNARQSPSIDLEQAQTLQSYLERHSVGASYSTSDNWMPLLRTPGTFAGPLHDIEATDTR